MKMVVHLVPGYVIAYVPICEPHTLTFTFQHGITHRLLGFQVK